MTYQPLAITSLKAAVVSPTVTLQELFATIINGTSTHSTNLSLFAALCSSHAHVVQLAAMSPAAALNHDKQPY